MRTLDSGEMQQECETADDLIGKRLGRRPQYFAYPYGYKNDSVCEFVRSRYKGAVTTELRMLASHEDTANLPRLDSYYLQGRWLQCNLDTILSRKYLWFRSLLRTLRGTQ
jgi:peptidoglycan/xylan/chitin deacetylase (PgdA/CDA1 family)